jgi:PhnB protein
MSANLSPYLNFVGTAAEALAFYQSVFGGEVTSMTFAEMGGMGLPEEEQGMVMHGQLDAEGLLLMCSDAPSHMAQDKPAGFAVALSGDDDATLRRWWEGLAEGAEIQEQLTVAPWGDAFGMLTDKFGTPWMVNIAGARPGQD